MEKLEGLMKELKVQENTIQERRKSWSIGARDLLKAQLEYYIQRFPSDWYTEINEDLVNYDVVSLIFGNSPSGIFDKRQNKRLSYIGGALHFSQIYNGKIYIWIEYPYIEELTRHDPP